MAEKSQPVNLHKAFSKVNETLGKLFDESGVKRSFTVPYIDGQPMGEHIAAVGAAAKESGGLTRNLVTTSHHSGGKGWGTGDGQTVGHPGHALKETIIPKDDAHAKKAIDAAQGYLDDMASLLGDDNPKVQTSQGQLNLVKKTDGAGMTLMDFGVLIQQIMSAPLQAVAQAHAATKPQGGIGLQPPRGQEPPTEAATPVQGEGQGNNQSAAPEASGPQEAAPEGAPETAPEAASAPAQGQ